MKTLNYIAAIACAALLLACDDSGPFYTATYPVTQVEVVVTVQASDPAPGPAPTQSLSESGEIPDAQQIIETISAQVVAQAPVAAGGRYTTDFTRHDGGTLSVVAASGAVPTRGTFDKQPGADVLQFTYDEHNYTCAIAAYTDANNTRRVVLEVDLTQHYQQLHPDWKITAVTRRELTSARHK